MEFKASDLRKSHFTLGNNQLDKITIYQKDYPPKKSQLNQAIDLIGIKKSHMNIGSSYAIPCNYQTTNSQKYIPFKIQPSALNIQKKNDLKRHHFKMGNFDNNKVATTNQFYYDKKEIPASSIKDSEAQKTKMRMHYHNFKQGPETISGTTYQKYYDKKQIQPGSILSPQQIYQKNQKIRDSNIIFGKEGVPFNTIHRQSYVPKESMPIDFKGKPYYASNVNLGDKGQDFQTTNLMYYKQYLPSYKPMTKQMKGQLAGINIFIATHFVMGGAKPQFTSQFKANFLKLNGQKSLPSLTNLQKNNFTLGINNKFNPETTYKREMNIKDIKAACPYLLTNQDKSTNFVMGKDNTPLSTEFKSKYIFFISFLPKSNIMSQGITPAGVLSVEQANSNLKLGYGCNDYMSTMKKDYKKFEGMQQNQLHSQLLAKFRQGSLKPQGGSFGGLTQYKDQYRKDQQNKLFEFHGMMFRV